MPDCHEARELIESYANYRDIPMPVVQ